MAKLKGRWQVQAGHHGFHTFGNFDDNGKYQPLPPSSLYQGYYGFGAATYDVTDAWSVGGWTDGGFTRSVDGPIERTSVFMNTARLDTQLLWRNSFIWMAPQYIATIPYFRNDLGQTSALVGEGAMEHTGLLHLFKRWQRGFHTYGYAGYRYRDEGRSHLIPWLFSMRARLQYFWLGATVEGVRTAWNDEFTKQARVRHTLLRNVNAASYKYFSVNPDWSRAELFAEWAPNRHWEFRLAGGSAFWGRNAAQDYSWMAAVTYTFGGDSDDRRFAPYRYEEERKIRKQRRREDRFRVSPDEESPTLFPEDLRPPEPE